MPRGRKKAPRFNDADERIDIEKYLIAVKQGTAKPRAAQSQIVEGLLSQPQAWLLAERYAHSLLDEAIRAAPHADEEVICLMAWSVASTTAELLTRRVEQQLKTTKLRT